MGMGMGAMPFGSPAMMNPMMSPMMSPMMGGGMGMGMGGMPPSPFSPPVVIPPGLQTTAGQLPSPSAFLQAQIDWLQAQLNVMGPPPPQPTPPATPAAAAPVTPTRAATLPGTSSAGASPGCGCCGCGGGGASSSSAAAADGVAGEEPAEGDHETLRRRRIERLESGSSLNDYGSRD